MDILIIIIVLGIFSIFTIIPAIRFIQTRNNKEFEGEKLIPFSCGKVFSAERYYFNSKGIFIFRASQLIHHYQFDDLIALEKMSVTVNNRKYWYMRIHTPNGQRHYQFIPKDMIFNDNFTQFYHFLKTNYPNKVKEKWYRWFAGI
ncbi:hypothetical protein BKG91_09275 [Rodentibacter caecimuris]|uniref:Uncharacterized protein n=2 Tax=Rodentibacter TaxID=1960084 RepID=A0A4S2PUV0_9PAST|nr:MULTISPECIES: hypothetical protein [Pasteurellaceae]AOF53079.1 hypothetical protein AC062_0985 [Pasteurellaceae bacterium NI1060]MCQ9123895.1 hypothetical protein [Rodentibacter heylii]MCR1836487.1 hypothetical protein [Pasteurella caecimuris]MCU0106593.1 hypothetical protein [Pasteurella caecimuris]MCX2961801.1 hypothetical protein [Rodentibacter heylii]